MLIAGALRPYINYFKTWASTTEAVFFKYGSVEKGIEAARSHPDFGYPFIWLEQPIIQPTNNGAGLFMDKYHTGICVLCEAPGDDAEAQIDASDKALAILTTLQAQLIKDQRAARLLFDEESMKIEAVSQLWLDNHYGWRLEVPLDLYKNRALFK